MRVIALSSTSNFHCFILPFSSFFQNIEAEKSANCLHGTLIIQNFEKLPLLKLLLANQSSDTSKLLQQRRVTLTSCSKVLHEKLIQEIAKVVKFHTFYGTRSLLNIFTTVLCCSILSHINPFNTVPSQFIKMIFNTCTVLTYCIQSLPQVF